MTPRFAPLALALAVACRAPALPPAQWFPTGSAFTTRYLTVDGTRLRYVDAGTGPAVIFLHGLGASLYAWRQVLGPVRAAGFRVIAFDNRGFGASDKPAHGYDNAAYAELLTGLMDSLGLADAVLVGHALGGAVAAEEAIAHPGRVRGLVLIGPAGLGVREPLLFRVARWPLVGPLVLAWRDRGLVERLLRSTYAEPGLVTAADVDQYYAPVAEPGYGRALRGVLREFRFDGLVGRLDRIGAPTLLLWGEQDRWVPVPVGRAMASEIPRSAFVTLPHVGHAVAEEASVTLTHLLLEFLKHGLPRVPSDLAGRPQSRHLLSTIRLMLR